MTASYTIHLQARYTDQMRKIIASVMMSLDGVMQAPGGPEEDTSGDFRFGGWTVPFADAFLGNQIREQVQIPFDLLLGRKTYEIFAPYWPNQIGDIANAFNSAKKYVISKDHPELYWDETILLHDAISDVQALKAQDGPMIQIYGSSKLLESLLSNDVIDELWLKIFPVVLGKGKRLFDGQTIPTSFELLDSATSSTGVIVATYARSGDVQTGSHT